MASQEHRLVLSVKARTWRGAYEPSDRVFQDVRSRVLERDRHTCVFCGFHSRKYQHVHHVDDDHDNNALSNLVTICSYCHMNFHIGKAGQEGATLAFVPELPPELVSHVWRAIRVALAWPHVLRERSERGMRVGTAQIEEALALHEAARRLLEFFAARRGKAEELLGTSSPIMLAELMLAAQRADKGFYDRREGWLHGIRLLPPEPASNAGVDDMTAFLVSREGPFGEGLSPGTWAAILRSAERANAEKTVTSGRRS